MSQIKESYIVFSVPSLFQVMASQALKHVIVRPPAWIFNIIGEKSIDRCRRTSMVMAPR